MGVPDERFIEVVQEAEREWVSTTAIADEIDEIELAAVRKRVKALASDGRLEEERDGRNLVFRPSDEEKEAREDSEGELEEEEQTEEVGEQQPRDFVRLDAKQQSSIFIEEWQSRRENQALVGGLLLMAVAGFLWVAILVLISLNMEPPVVSMTDLFLTTAVFGTVGVGGVVWKIVSKFTELLTG